MTTQFGLLGRNISYSLSPKIHGANINSNGMDASYRLFDVKRIEEFLPHMETLDGFNVTIPYKEAILTYCDEIDRSVKAIGACNTVKRENGKNIAYNTDWVGFYQLLEQNGVLKQFEKAKVLVIGAGGAAKAILYALTKCENYEVTLANRTLDKAKELSPNVIEFSMVSETLEIFDIVIQTTNVGVKTYASPIEIKKIKENSVFIDLNYQQHLKFLDDSKKLGAKTINGIDMLIGQAAESFRLWTGQVADIQAMKDALEKGENKC